MIRYGTLGHMVLGSILLAACTAPGTPAPVPTESGPSPSPWQWQSAEPTPATGDLAITGGTPVSPNPSDATPPSDGDATRRLVHQPGVAGQPMAVVGECVDLQRAEDGHTTFVSKACDQAHQAQVVGYIDVLDGPQAPAPPLRRLQGLAAHHCPILGSEFLGESLAHRRDLTVNWTGPARREWAGGARTLICMLSGAPTSDGQGTQPLMSDLHHGQGGHVDIPASPSTPPAVSPAPMVELAPPAQNP